MKSTPVTHKQADDRLKDFKDIFATKEDLVNTRSERIKWMFIFWASQLAATFALSEIFCSLSILSISNDNFFVFNSIATMRL